MRLNRSGFLGLIGFSIHLDRFSAKGEDGMGQRLEAHPGAGIVYFPKKREQLTANGGIASEADLREFPGQVLR